MNDLQPSQPPGDDQSRSRAMAERGDVLYCRYCGATLSSMFYFCTKCGTPYKDIETLLAPTSPPVLTESDRIKMKAPMVWPLFFTYLAVILGVGIFSAIVFKENRPDLMLLVNDIAIFITTCIFAVMYRSSLAAQFRTFGFNHPAALIGMGLLIVALAVNYAYFTFLTELLKDNDGASVDFLSQLREAGVSELSLIIGFCVFPAVTEEIAFRGLVQHWLRTAVKPMRALVLASFLFAILHLSVLSLPYLFAVGMLLGWVKWKTGSLYPCMLIHFLHNLVVIEFFG